MGRKRSGPYAAASVSNGAGQCIASGCSVGAGWSARCRARDGLSKITPLVWDYAMRGPVRFWWWE